MTRAFSFYWQVGPPSVTALSWFLFRVTRGDLFSLGMAALCLLKLPPGISPEVALSLESALCFPLLAAESISSPCSSSLPFARIEKILQKGDSSIPHESPLLKLKEILTPRALFAADTFSFLSVSISELGPFELPPPPSVPFRRPSHKFPLSTTKQERTSD